MVALGRSHTGTIKAGGPMAEDFEVLLRLFTNELTAKQHDRQVATLKQLLNVFIGGLPVLCGIQGIPETLEKCGQKISQGHDEFIPPLLIFLEKCAHPFVPQRTQDKLLLKQCTLNVINAVAGLLGMPNEKVCLHVVEALTEIVDRARAMEPDDLAATWQFTKAEKGKSKNSPVGLHYNNPANSPSASRVKHNDVQLAIEESHLVLQLVEALGSSHTPDVQVALLTALKGVSRYALCCRTLTLEGGLAQLFQVLDDHSIQDYQASVALEVIWNVLELHPPATALVTEPHYITLLYHLIREGVTHGYKLKEKELRNDCIAICTLIAQNPKSHPYFFASGLTELLFIVSAGLELGIQHELLQPFTQTLADEDFELKKMAWGLLYILSFHGDNAAYLNGVGLMQGLLYYLDIDCAVPEVLRWPTIQLMDLQALALHAITQLAILCPISFAETNGPGILLSFLQQCSDDSLQDATLNALFHLANSDNKAALVDAGAMGIMIDIANETVNLNVKRYCLEIIGDLCRGTGLAQSNARCQFGDDGGLDLVLPVLQLVPQNVIMEELVAAAVECVWNCVVGSENEKLFLKQQGIHRLLGLLACCSERIRLPLLTCLVDCFRSPAMVAQAQAWTLFKVNTPVQKLLVQLWSQASSGFSDPEKVKAVAEMQVAQVERGTIPFILNSTQGLDSSHYSPLLSFILNANDSDSSGDTDFADSQARLIKGTDMKAKIYCLFSQLGFDGDESLSLSEKVILAEICQYLEDRQDRIWEYIEVSLEDEGCRPTTADGARLQQLSQSRSQRREKLLAAQEFWREKDATFRAEADKTFYQTLIKKADDPELLEKSMRNGMSITQAKIRKKEMLKASYKASQQLQEQLHGQDVQPVIVEAQTSESKLPQTPSSRPRSAVSVVLQARRTVSAPSGDIPQAANIADLAGFIDSKPKSAPSNTAPLIPISPFQIDSLDAFTILGVNADQMSPTVKSFADRTSANQGTTEGHRFLSQTEYDVFQSVRNLRLDPKSFILKLKLLQNIALRETEEHITGNVDEVRQAFEDAIRRLQSKDSVKNIKVVPIGLTMAARDLALSLGLKGLDSAGDDLGLDPQTRVHRYGALHGEALDCVALGRKTADEIVCQMLLDAKQMDVLLHPACRYIGIGVAWHRLKKYICVATLATVTFAEKSRELQESLHERFTYASLAPGGRLT